MVLFASTHMANKLSRTPVSKDPMPILVSMGTVSRWYTDA